MYSNTIINGDCRNILRTIPSASIDFVLTDPPYVGRYTSRDGRTIRNDNWNWLNPAFKGTSIVVLKRDAFCVCFYGWGSRRKIHQRLFATPVSSLAVIFRFRSNMFQEGGISPTSTKRRISWSRADPASALMPCADVIEWRDLPKNDLHPTQKPLSVLIPLIEEFCPPGGTVLDPFAGSGSSTPRREDAGPLLCGYRA